MSVKISHLLNQVMQRYTKADQEKELMVEIEDFQKLNDAISEDLEHRLEILLDNDVYKLIKERQGNGEYLCAERGKHDLKPCDCVAKTNGKNEHPICKCMFYYDRTDENQREELCVNCPMEYYWTNVGSQYEVIDYEYPMSYAHGVPGVGEVDLVLRDINNGDVYAVEIKKKDSDETLARMMAETLTYTAILKSSGVHGTKAGKRLIPSIAFFEESKLRDRYEMYKSFSDPVFDSLLKEIKVFFIRDTMEGKISKFEFVMDK